MIVRECGVLAQSLKEAGRAHGCVCFSREMEAPRNLLGVATHGSCIHIHNPPSAPASSPDSPSLSGSEFACGTAVFMPPNTLLIDMIS